VFSVNRVATFVEGTTVAPVTRPILPPVAVLYKNWLTRCVEKVRKFGEIQKLSAAV